MITISVCMIVKDEAPILARCLDCITCIADEIIIVDTGSTDNTKAIAARYTDKIYDFKWINDFSAARNFAFSKATMDYIYSADADEVIDEQNQQKFIALKEAMLPEIEITQMYYANQLNNGSTYNFDRELRPKLYKRLRNFNWRSPIHEAVVLDPVIYDSDIEILHMAEANHADRDFIHFQHAIKLGNTLDSRLNILYAKELFISGTYEDFLEAADYFSGLSQVVLTDVELKAVECVLVRLAIIKKDINMLLKFSLKNIADGEGSSEVCYYLGEYYYGIKDYKEAILWYYNAAFETTCELDLKYSKDYPIERLITCYELLGNYNETKHYKDMLHNDLSSNDLSNNDLSNNDLSNNDLSSNALSSNNLSN